MIYLYNMRHDKFQAIGASENKEKLIEKFKICSACPRSTLCEWFQNEEWSKHIKKSNVNIQIKISVERLKKLHDGRKIMLEKNINKLKKTL